MKSVMEKGSEECQQPNTVLYTLKQPVKLTKISVYVIKISSGRISFDRMNLIQQAMYMIQSSKLQTGNFSPREKPSVYRTRPCSVT